MKKKGRKERREGREERT